MRNAVLQEENTRQDSAIAQRGTLRRLRRWDWLLATLGLALIAGSLSLLLASERDVSIETQLTGDTPVTIYRAAESKPPYPVVLISHGFAGSQQLMQSFSLSLARSGYLAVSFDYLGHGRNRAPLGGNITKVEGATQKLIEQTREIADFALALPAASGDLALLGHSMASDIIVRYAASDPRVQATIAVSMFSPAVTEEAPRNLLVIVGGLEGFLKDEALRVQGLVTEQPREAVTVGAFADGSARRVVFADGVEHVGVLYSEESLREAVGWLNGVFGARSIDVTRGRGPAIMALLLGLSLLVLPLSRLLPLIASPPRGAALGWRALLFAGLTPALVTPLLLAGFPADFMGVLVGGYLAVHFLVYGGVSFGCLLFLSRGKEAKPPGDTNYIRLGAAAVLASIYLAGVFGLVLDSFVTSYAITSTRLPLLLLTLAGTLGYFLADEWLTHGEPHARGGHLFTRLCFLLSLGLAVALSFEDLFFLLIIAAVIVVYFLLYGLFSRWVYQATGHPTVGAIANAITFAWALAAVFPFIQP